MTEKLLTEHQHKQNSIQPVHCNVFLKRTLSTFMVVNTICVCKTQYAAGYNYMLQIYCAEKVCILINWHHQKPADLDLYCFQKRS